MENYKKIVSVRGNIHGDFTRQFKVAQELKRMLKDAAKASGVSLDPVLQESLDMICLKQSRIVTGDPTYPDHWDDIAGYANKGSEYVTGNKIFSSLEDPNAD